MKYFVLNYINRHILCGDFSLLGVTDYLVGCCCQLPDLLIVKFPIICSHNSNWWLLPLLSYFILDFSFSFLAGMWAEPFSMWLNCTVFWGVGNSFLNACFKFGAWRQTSEWLRFVYNMSSIWLSMGIWTESFMWVNIKKNLDVCHFFNVLCELLD